MATPTEDLSGNGTGSNVFVKPGKPASVPQPPLAPWPTIGAPTGERLYPTMVTTPTAPLSSPCNGCGGSEAPSALVSAPSSLLALEDTEMQRNWLWLAVAFAAGWYVGKNSK